MTSPLRPPPLAVVQGAARALAIDAPESDRLRALCDHLRVTLPAAEVRVALGQRRSDRLAAGHAAAGTPICMVDIAWPDGRHGTLEAIGSDRLVTECRPILETVAAMVVAATTTHFPPPTDAELERRLHWLTVDSLPVGLYVVDREYRIVIWNRKRETGTQGLRRAEVLGSAGVRCAAPSVARSVARGLRARLRGGRGAGGRAGSARCRRRVAHLPHDPPADAPRRRRDLARHHDR
jgi:hypothetical protein